MSPQEERDPLADLLSSVKLLPIDSQRKEAIFVQTRGVLRRRRLVRRSLRLAALAACYVVGVFSVLGWQSLRSRSELDVRTERIAGDLSESSPEGSHPPSDPKPAATFDATDHAIAQSKPADRLTTFEKLRRAGDRQLNERGNLKGALGCYQRALQFANDDELQIVPERDSWLLMSLKESQLEARKHVDKKS